MRVTSLVLMFKLLDHFASERNPYASIIYKKLTFSLIENHSDVMMREMIIKNFISIFKKFSSIPIEILIEPLITQIQVGGLF